MTAKSRAESLRFRIKSKFFKPLARLVLMKARLSSDTNYSGGLFDIPDGLGGPVDVGDKEAVQEFKEKFDSYIEDEEHTEKREADGKVYRRSLKSDFDYLENGMDFREFLTDDFDEKLRQYIGCDYRIIGLRAFRNYHHPEPSECGWVGNNTYLWHVDSFIPSLVKFFVPLDDIDRDTGSLRYIDQKDTKDVLKKYGKEKYSEIDGVVDQNYDVNYVECDRGSGYFMNVYRHLHRAGTLDKGDTRDMLMFFIVPTVDPEDRVNFVDDSLEYLIGGGQIKEVL